MLPLSVKQVKLLYQCENAYYSSKCFCNVDFVSVLDLSLSLYNVDAYHVENTPLICEANFFLLLAVLFLLSAVFMKLHFSVLDTVIKFDF